MKYLIIVALLIFANLSDYYTYSRNLTTEFGFAYDDYGDVIWSKSGDENCIGISLFDMYILNGLHFVHNHPNNSSFSGPDLDMAIKCHLKSIEVIRAEGGNLRVDYFPQKFIV